MSWARLDDCLHDDPRTDRAGLEAIGLFAIALSWMAEKRTATITRERLFKLAGRKGHWLGEKLVAAGWWEALPDRSFRLVNPGGFLQGFGSEPPPVQIEPPPVKSGVQSQPPPVQLPSQFEPPGKPGGVPAPPFPSPPLAPRAHAPDPDLRSGSLTGDPCPGRLEGKEEIRDLDLPLFRAVRKADETPLPVSEVTKKDPPPTDVERAIFDAFLRGRSWREVKHGAVPVLDAKRVKLIRDRMREGHTAEALRGAAFGVWVSPWHFDKGQCRFDLALRDAAHVDQFATLAAEREAELARYNRPKRPLDEHEDPDDDAPCPEEDEDLGPPLPPSRTIAILESFGLHEGARAVREAHPELAEEAANG